MRGSEMDEDSDSLRRLELKLKLDIDPERAWLGRDWSLVAVDMPVPAEVSFWNSFFIFKSSVGLILS